MSHQSLVTFTLEQRILHTLMLRTTFLDDLGLLSEKMGVLLAYEIDEKIMAADPQRISDVSMESGLEVILHYALIHIQFVGRKVQKNAFRLVKVHFSRTKYTLKPNEI